MVQVVQTEIWFFKKPIGVWWAFCWQDFVIIYFMAERPSVWDGRPKEIISGVTSVLIPKRDEIEIAGSQTKADYRIIKNWWSAGTENLAKRRRRFNLDEFLGQEGTVHVLSLSETSKAIDKDPKSRVLARARKALGLGKEVEGGTDEWRFSRLQLLQLMVGSFVLTDYYRPVRSVRSLVHSSRHSFAALK